MISTIFKKWNIILSILFLFSLTGCTISDKGEIFYDDEMIARRGDSFTYISRVGDMNHMEFKGFSGTETIYSASDNVNINITFECSITRGEFKVVLIDESDNVSILEVEQSYDLSLSLNSRIKIVGDAAYGLLEVNIHENA